MATDNEGRLNGGYAGRVLQIDLSGGLHRVTPLDPELAERYVGGRGFVARTLYDGLSPGTDPLGPDNLVAIAVGPLTGVFLPGCGKTHFGTLSPSTGGYGDSNIGGHFGAELKYAGYDLVVLKGIAQEPVIVVIDDDEVHLKPAGEYW